MKAIHIMKIYRYLTFALLLLLYSTSAIANDNKEKVFRGYEGGMMLHTGYLWGDITPLAHHAQGLTKGIGGAIRLKLGNHWRIGTEGYTSSMK